MKTIRLLLRIIISPAILVINAIPLAVFPSIVAPVLGILMAIRAVIVPERILFPSTRKSELIDAAAFGTAFIWVPVCMTWSWITDGEFGNWQ